MIWPCMQSFSDLNVRASVKWQCPGFSLWPHCCVDTMSFWTWTWTNFETLWLEGSAPYNLDWLSFYFSLTSTFHLGPSLERSNEVEFLSQKFVRDPKWKVDMETLWDWEMDKSEKSEKLEIALTTTVLKLELSNLAHLSFRHWRTSPQNLGQFGQLFYFLHVHFWLRDSDNFLRQKFNLLGSIQTWCQMKGIGQTKEKA